MGLITLFFRYSSTTWPTWARLGAETTCLPTLPSPLEPNLREDWETISFDWKAQIMRPRRRPWWLPSQRLNLSPCDVWCTTVNDATSQHRVSKKEFLEKTDQSPVSSSQWHPESSLESSGWVRNYLNSEQLWPKGRDTTGYILELMELENIVANTVYLKAREGGPEGSKGRR